MKHLRRFNEHFDSAEIKQAIYDTELLPYLQGELFNVPLRKVKNFEFERDTVSIVSKIILKFPHLKDFYINDTKTPGVTYIYKKNKDWFVSLGIGVDYIGIVYKYNKATDGKIINDLTFRGFEWTYIKEWKGVSDEEMMDIIQYNFLPILLKCGFRDELKSGRDDINTQMN